MALSFAEQDLAEPERLVWTAFLTGSEVDLREGDQSHNEPLAGEAWESSRVIRAEVIRELVLGTARPSAAATPALRMKGARISGQLDFSHSAIPYPIYLQGCSFEQAPDLRWAEVGHLDLSQSALPGLQASHVYVKGELRAQACQIAGDVWLYGAKIAGDVRLNGSVLGPMHCALVMSGCTVGGALYLNDMAISGSIRLIETQVSGSVMLSGTRISAPGSVALDCSRLKVGAAVFCREHFTCEGQTVLRNARIGSFLDLDDARLSHPCGHALLAPGLVADGGLTFRGTVEGAMNLVAARIGRSLNLSGAHVVTKPGEVAFQGTRITVDGPIFCWDSFTCEGEMQLRRAHLGGVLDFDHARISNPAGTALFAPGLLADGGVSWSNASSIDGAIILDYARIVPDLNLAGAQLTSGGIALSCRYVEADQLRLPVEPVSGRVDLCHAKLGMLDADPCSTPSGIVADDLTYGTLAPALPAQRRIEWLARAGGYTPQPYEQLAASYRRSGQDGEACKVLLAKERRRHNDASFPVKVWGQLQDLTTGYGYQPAKAAACLLVLLAVGTTIFAIHAPPALVKGSSEQFNPFFYTVDLLVPVATYGQRTAFAPSGVYQWIAYGLTSCGWILATSVAAGIARVLRRG